MSYKIGDVVLVKFPFTDFKSSKKRPVLVIKDENKFGDIVCFQITSKQTQENLKQIANSDIVNGSLLLESYVKYDKCFTISSDVIDKKIAKLDSDLLSQLKLLFCEVIF